MAAFSNDALHKPIMCEFVSKEKDALLANDHTLVIYQSICRPRENDRGK